SVITAGTGYRLLVRGSRAVDLSNNAATPSNTILRTRGSLRTGTIVYNSATNPSINSNMDYFSLIGNPYASPVDWDASPKVGLSPYYYVWDPNLNIRGAYVTYGNGITSQSGSQVNQNIQSGQSFFVRTKAANPSLTFTETNKTTVQRNVFRMSSDVMRLAVQLLLKNSIETNDIADGISVLFDPTFTSEISIEDAGKMSNMDESMSIISNATSLSIEGRPPITATDTIHLQMIELRQKNYYLKFEANGFKPGVTALVRDQYLNKETELDGSGETLLPFSITEDSASFAKNRFRIIFKAEQVLPIMISDVKAFKKASGIQVEWNVQEETAVEMYEVEKSINGQRFEKAGVVAVKANRNSIEVYSWYDEHVHDGNNFYRVKCIEKTGAIKYSSVVSVNIKKNEKSITIFPNPVSGNTINVRMDNIEKGIYTIAIYSNAGRKIYSGSINHNGTFGNYKIFTGKVVSSGNYKLQISNGDKTFIENVQFQ
ncbi:MAG TPA: T9SS type A sorting domain-containing protein, partial [Segetibacter sp.]